MDFYQKSFFGLPFRTNYYNSNGWFRFFVFCPFSLHTNSYKMVQIVKKSTLL